MKAQELREKLERDLQIQSNALARTLKAVMEEINCRYEQYVQTGEYYDIVNILTSGNSDIRYLNFVKTQISNINEKFDLLDELERS